MDRQEYCETKCKDYTPVKGECKYLAIAKKPIKVFSFTVTKKGSYYCTREK